MEEHPVLAHAPSLQTLQRRARFVQVALGCTIAQALLSAGAREAWARAAGDSPSADSILAGTATAHTLLLIVTAVGFLLWMHRLVALTRALDGHMLRWRPGQAVWGFVVPILSLFRPYQNLRDVQRLLISHPIAEPPPQPVRDAAGGYRTMTFTAVPPGKSLSNAFIGWWWGLYVVQNLMPGALPPSAGGEGFVFDLLTAVSAAFALVLTSRLTARLADRYRRIRWTPVEALGEQGIVLG